MIGFLNFLCLVVLFFLIISLSLDVYYKVKRNKGLNDLKKLNKEFQEHINTLKQQ